MFIKLASDNLIEIDGEITALELASKMGEEVERSAVAVKIDGQIFDLSAIIDKDCEVKFITLKDKEGLYIYRHTCAHVLAQAVKTIYPTCELGVGPVTENGFYYDFHFKTPISQKDLTVIEEEMNKIIKSNLPIKRIELPRKKAVSLMKEYDEKFKVQIIEELPTDKIISVYKQGGFTDLCKGVHLPSTGKIQAFKLLSVSGAYWKGNRKNVALTRIFGTAFPRKCELDEYLIGLEELKKRDHNKLGRELGYFTTVDDVGQGLAIMLEKGSKTLQILERFIEDEEERRGYILTKTPLLAKGDLFKTAGRWEHNKEEMFLIGDGSCDSEILALRSMACPFQFQVYLNKTRSYRDLPMRLGETAILFKNEDSGEMRGLNKMRQFTISEGHIICTPSMLATEFKECVDLANGVLKALGLEEDVRYRFSKWNPQFRRKYMGTAKEWESVQAKMTDILDELNIAYYEEEGKAAYYGPKLDFQTRNLYGKEETLMTVQIDFQLAKRFGMTYIDDHGNKKYPYILHRTSLGSYERMLALLIEKYRGAMPLWVAPTQVEIISLSANNEEYCKEIREKLLDNGIRVHLDLREERLGKKIRDAQLDKVPYMLVIGDRETEDGGLVSVRRRSEGDLGSMTLGEFIERIKFEIKTKKIN